MNIEITAEHEAAHDRLRALVHLDVSDVIFYLRVQGDQYRFDEVNAAFLRATGLREEEVIGKLVDEVIPEPSLTLARAKYAEAIREGRTVRWDEMTDYPTGRSHGEVSVTPVVDKTGRCVSLIGTVRDVTAARQLDDQLRELAARIDAAREDERAMIAREIHDQLGQSLTLLKVDLAWIARRAAADNLPRDQLLDKVASLAELADELIREVRRISTELRPAILDEVGLDAALAWQAEEFERRTKIVCRVHSGLSDDDRIPRPIATAVFRVFQEALTNVIRHAGATRVDVRIEETTTGLVLVVADDGTGISDEQLTDPRSLGLLGMRERARRLGGTVTIARRKPRGTVVTLDLPG